MLAQLRHHRCGGGYVQEDRTKHIWALVDKGLIQTEDTTIRRKNGLAYNGSLLYTLKPIKQVLKEREKEMLVELKLAEVQRKWTQRVKLSESAARCC